MGQNEPKTTIRSSKAIVFQTLEGPAVNQSQTNWERRVETIKTEHLQLSRFLNQLIKAGADVDLLLMAAAEGTHIPIVQILVDKHKATGQHRRHTSPLPTGPAAA